MKARILILVLSFSLMVSSSFAADNVISISTSYKSLLSTPDQNGMLDKIVKEAFRRIGVQAEIVFTPTERSLIAVNDGILDGEMNRIAGMDETYTNLVRVPEPNMQMHFVAFAKKDIPFSGWESLRSLKVGLINGWKILERNTKGFPFVTQVFNDQQLFRMLDKGRIDVALYSKLNGFKMIHDLELIDIRCLSPSLADRDMFLYLNKKHAGLVLPVAKALREMKRDGTYDHIVKETTDTLQ